MGHKIKRHKVSRKKQRNDITAGFDQALKNNTAQFVVEKHAVISQKIALAKMTDEEFNAAQGKIDEQAKAELEKAKPADKDKLKTSLDTQVADFKKAQQEQRDAVKKLDEKGLAELEESAVKLPSKVKVAQDKDSGKLVESDDGEEMDVAEFLAKDTAQKTGQKLDGGLVKWALKTQGGWRTKSEKSAGVTKSVSDVWLAEGQRRAGVPMAKDNPNTPVIIGGKKTDAEQPEVPTSDQSKAPITDQPKAPTTDQPKTLSDKPGATPTPTPEGTPIPNPQATPSPSPVTDPRSQNPQAQTGDLRALLETNQEFSKLNDTQKNEVKTRLKPDDNYRYIEKRNAKNEVEKGYYIKLEKDKEGRPTDVKTQDAGLLDKLTGMGYSTQFVERADGKIFDAATNVLVADNAQQLKDHFKLAASKTFSLDQNVALERKRANRYDDVNNTIKKACESGEGDAQKCTSYLSEYDKIWKDKSPSILQTSEKLKANQDVDDTEKQKLVDNLKEYTAAQNLQLKAAFPDKSAEIEKAEAEDAKPVSVVTPEPSMQPTPNASPVATPKPNPVVTSSPQVKSTPKPVSDNDTSIEMDAKLNKYALAAVCQPDEKGAQSAACSQYASLAEKRFEDFKANFSKAKTDAEAQALEKTYIEDDKKDIEKAGLTSDVNVSKKEIEDTRNSLKAELKETQQIYVQQVPEVPVLDEANKPVTKEVIDPNTNKKISVPDVAPSRDDEGNLLGYYAKYVKTANGWDFVQLTDEEKAKFANDADETKPEFAPKIIQLVGVDGKTKTILNWKKFVDDKKEETLFENKDDLDSFLK